MSIRPIAAWRQMENWFSSQGAITQQDAALNDAANSAFANAQSSYFQSLASLTEQVALKRVQAEAQAKSAALRTLINSIGGSVNKVA
jgi:ATP-dependent protease ClpP protease subunit